MKESQKKSINGLRKEATEFEKEIEALEKDREALKKSHEESMKDVKRKDGNQLYDWWLRQWPLPGRSTADPADWENMYGILEDALEILKERGKIRSEEYDEGRRLLKESKFKIRASL